MSRVEHLLPAQLDAAQAELYATLTGGPRRGQAFSMQDGQGRLLGPFDALLRAPDLGAAVEQVGVRLRYHGVLSARERELLILFVAAGWRSSYEWYAHSAVVRENGLATEQELSILAEGGIPDSCSARERAMLNLVEGLVGERSVSDSTFEEAQRHLTASEITEVVVCFGYYGLLAALLATFDVGAPDQENDPFTSEPDRT